MSHRILVAQGGGPTAVINQSLVGVALEARRFPEFTHVYGARHGVRGIVDHDLVDLGQAELGHAVIRSGHGHIPAIASSGMDAQEGRYLAS